MKKLLLLLIVALLLMPTLATASVRCKWCVNAAPFYDPCAGVVRTGLEVCAATPDPNGGSGCSGTGAFYCVSPCQQGEPCDTNTYFVRLYYTECHKVGHGFCTPLITPGDPLGINEVSAIPGAEDALKIVRLLDGSVPEDGWHAEQGEEPYKTTIIGKPPMGVRIETAKAVVTVWLGGGDELLCYTEPGAAVPVPSYICK